MKNVTAGTGWAFIPEQGQASAAAADTRAPQPKIRVEKRAGKKVTIITGLHTYGEERLQALARALKTSCAAGGTLKNGIIEIQGDKVTIIQAWFKKQGH
jgi:translation initiation factor 1